MVVKLDRVRYLKVHFLNQPPPIGQYVNSLRNSISILKGEIFLANASLNIVEYNRRYAIIRCTHKSRDTVESAIQIIMYEDLVPRITKVSGTLKSLSNTAIDDPNDDK